MISAFTNMFNQRIYRLRSGLVDYKFSGHVVIIGGNRSILSVINNYQPQGTDKSGIPKIVIVSSKRPSELLYLKDSVKPGIWSNLYFINDNILMPVMDYKKSNHFLDKCNIQKAREIHIIGDRESSSSDNLSILNHLLSYYSNKNKDGYQFTQDCFMSYSNLEMLITSLREYDKEEYNGILEHCRIMPYDYNMMLASKVWGASVDPESSYHPVTISATGICSIVIIGFNNMAQAMLKMAMLKCHFGKGCVTNITIFVEERESHEVDLFKTNYDIASLGDISIEFVVTDHIALIDTYTEHINKQTCPTVVLCAGNIDMRVQLAYSIKKVIPGADILIYSETPLLHSLANDNMGNKRSDFNSFGNINQGIEIKSLFNECIKLYMIRDYLKSHPECNEDMIDIMLKSKEEQEKAVRNFFGYSFDNARWRLMALIESFGNPAHKPLVNTIDNDTILNQYVASIVLSGYSVVDRGESIPDKAEAFRQKTVGYSNLDIIRVRNIMNVYLNGRKYDDNR